MTRTALSALITAVSICLVRGASASDEPIEQVEVIGLAPANVQTVSQQTIENSHALTLSDLLADNVNSVFLSDTEANPFQQDLYFRGFDASPVLGSPIGLAVYQDSVRVNERFGDTVLWDIVPSFAIDHIDVVTGSDPVFGLNALGGAVVLGMKTGFTSASGASLDVSSGSFGRTRLVFEDAGQSGNQAFYLGAMATYDGGWRRSSSSDVLQAYGSYAIQTRRASLEVNLTLAGDFLNENAAVPTGDDPRAAFSIPDTARDQLVLLQGQGEFALAPNIILRSTIYARSAHLETANGQASGFEACSSDPTLLCSGDDSDEPLTSIDGSPIAASAGGQGTDATGASMTNTLGTSQEVDLGGRVFGLNNSASAGVALDLSHTEFHSQTELGSLTLQPSGDTVIPDAIFLGGPAWNVALRAVNLDLALYGQDSLQLTDALSVQVSARADFDRIDLSDRLGGALSGNHNFQEVNPALTATWRTTEGSTVYASIGQSSRTPTAAELSCANPSLPCLFPLSFISDPDLREVVARTAELGARGDAAWGDATWSWTADAYFTRSDNDIIFVSSGPFLGSGYFSNVGGTQRVGADASLDLKFHRFDFRAKYGFIDATFESAFAAPSAFNPGSDTNGNIFVRPGDRLPSIPRSTARLEFGYRVTPHLHLELNTSLRSGSFFRGDEANLQPQLPGFAVFGLDSEYQLSDATRLYVIVDNLFDRRYATFGLYSDPTGNGALPQFSNPRFIVPGEPFGIWLGLHSSLSDW